jgi:hypothetical protein
VAPIVFLIPSDSRSGSNQGADTASCIINGMEFLKVTLADSLFVRYIAVYVNLPYFRRLLCLLLLDLI